MRSLLLAALALTACSPDPTPPPRPLVVLMTDFGTTDDAVGLVRGAVLAVAPDAQVLDLTHEVPAYDLEAGARLLEDAPGVYPEGTVFVAVVDPGVGTPRRAIVVRLANGRWLVGPDNGVLSLAMARHGVDWVRAIEDRRFLRPEISSTFHGRDVFAPTAGHLAIGSPPPADVGPVVEDWIRVEPRPVVLVPGPPPALEARVVALDEPFGNVWTDVGPADLERLGARPERLVFRLGDAGREVEAPLAGTFGDVPEGQPLAYWNSRGRLSLAINMGDAAHAFGVERGARVVVRRP